MRALQSDLASGAWDAKYSAWRQLPVFEGSLRLLVSHSRYLAPAA